MSESNETKTCSKCARECAASNFYGREGACKPCRRAKISAYKRSDAGRKVTRQYKKSEDGRAARGRYRASDLGRATRSIRDKKYRLSPKGSAMESAGKAVRSAIKTGLMRRASESPCSVGPDGCAGAHEHHHGSYLAEHRLDVVVLCRSHHEGWHAENEAVYP